MGVKGSREDSVHGEHIQKPNSPLAAFAASWALASGFHRADA